MNEWKIGLVIAPLLIAGMALLLRRKRAISTTTLGFVLAVTAAITAVLFSM